MEVINYQGRQFRAVVTSLNGEVDAETIFTYHQQGDAIWAEYQGGKIIIGQMAGIVLPDQSLDLRYQHVNTDYEIMTGRCLSTPEVLADGRLQLHEVWQWTCGDHSSGESVIEEMLSLNFNL